jgi:hypothetical protein
MKKPWNSLAAGLKRLHADGAVTFSMPCHILYESPQAAHLAPAA